MPEKFDNTDRAAVIRLIEQAFDVKLKKADRLQKWLRDETGRHWCVIGGIGDFHGIPKQIMECEREGAADDQLVLAKKLVDRLDVYAGSLRPLIDARNCLHRRERDCAYLFNINVKSGHIRVNKAPNVVLKKIFSLPHTHSDRDSIKRVEDFTKLVGSMSRDELLEVLEEFRLQRLDREKASG